MKTISFALFFIVINSTQRLLEQTNTTCNLEILKVSKEGSTDVSYDINLQCTSNRDGKEVKLSKNKHCATGQKFFLTTFKKTAKVTPEETNEKVNDLSSQEKGTEDSTELKSEVK